jgi:hypothetical protein
VTSVAGLATEAASVVVFAAYAAGSAGLDHATLFVLAAAVYLPIAAAIARGEAGPRRPGPRRRSGPAERPVGAEARRRRRRVRLEPRALLERPGEHVDQPAERARSPAVPAASASSTRWLRAM